MNIPQEEVQQVLHKVLIDEGFPNSKAALVAQIFSASSRDGYHSHGLNRFKEFVKNVRKGIIDPKADPELKSSIGAIERWNGHRGAGPSNAWQSMERCIELAQDKGMAIVALENTNHWMRGGTYGWQAAEAGCISICFTNTMPNMPPWGGKTATTGNNPLIIAVPHQESHVVIDMSLSQFSYGKLYEHQLKGKSLPLPGGYDEQGNLTTDPEAIIQTRRILQTGYWKGSGLSLMLDLLATLISGGHATADIAGFPAETGLSQIFLCIDSQTLNGPKHDAIVDKILSFYCSAVPEHPGQTVKYPGQSTYERRQRSLAKGITVDEKIWEGILALVK